MQFRNWKNHYIDLVSSKPGLIYAESDREISSSTIEEIAARIKRFPTCFIELGSGSGGHLIELAARNPDTLCIGFELRFKRTFRTAEKAEERGLSNLSVIRSSAGNLSKIFAPRTIDRVFVNFPDPWDKKGWRKHRMINSESLQTISSLLKADGVIRYKTDHMGSFDDTVGLIESSNLFKITKVTRDLYGSEYLSENITTEFENLFLSQGLPVFFVEAAVN